MFTVHAPVAAAATSMTRTACTGALSLLLAAATTVQAQDCFATRAELKMAVQVYLTDPTDAFLSTTYGLPIGSWCVGAVSDFSGIFAGARTFNEPLGDWDVSAARTLATMFQGAAIFDQDLSGWNTSAVVSLAGTFQGAEAFNQSVSNWDTSSVTSLEATFQAARAFNQPLDGWDTAAVTNMADLFSFCTVFNQPLGHFNVSQVRSLNGAFSFAEEFLGEGLETWDTSKVIDMSDLFWNAVNFNGDISGWQTSAVLNLHRTFADAHVFNQALPWNVASVIDLRYVCDVPVCVTRAFVCGDPPSIGRALELLTVVDRRSHHFVTYGFACTASFTFFDARLFAGTGLETWDVSSVVDMESAFVNTSAFNMDISDWSVAQVQDMSDVFANSTIFAQDLCAWGDKVGSAATANGAFVGTACPEVGSPNLLTDPAGPFCYFCGTNVPTAGPLVQQQPAGPAGLVTGPPGGPTISPFTTVDLNSAAPVTSRLIGSLLVLALTLSLMW